MFPVFEKAVLGMAVLRIFSGNLEILAALLMLKLNDVEKALIVNSSLALTGPIVLILTTSIALISIADKISFTQILWIFAGVLCILYGIRSHS